MTTWLAAAVVAALAPVAARAAVHTWTGTGFFGNATRTWSDPFNWNGGPPTTNEAPPVILVFPESAAEKLSTNDIGNLVVDEIRITGNNYALFGRSPGSILTLRNGGSVNSTGSGNRIAGSLSLQLSAGRNANEFNVATNQTLRIESVLRGAGGFTKLGSGILLLDSVVASLYTGTTRVEAGRLDLSAGLSGGTTCIPGDLVIGAPGSILPAEVRYAAADQVIDSARVTIHSTGRFQSAGFTDTIGSLELFGGRFYTDGALVTLGGGITSSGSSVIDGAISLGNATREVIVHDGQLTITATIAGGEGVGLVKSGIGALSLAGENTYPGPVTVTSGFLGADHTKAFGPASGGVTVANGASLFIGSFKAISAEPLAIQGAGLGGDGALQLGNNSGWSGPIVLDDDTRVVAGGSPSVATLTGPISGPGRLNKHGTAPLLLGGTEANSNTGGLHVAAGTVRLAKPSGVTAVAGNVTVAASAPVQSNARLEWYASHQIADTSVVFTSADAELALGSAVETIAMLDGGAKLEINGGILGISSPNIVSTPTRFSGQIVGTASSVIWKGGARDVEFAGTGPYAGLIRIDEGEFVMSGNLSSAAMQVESGAALYGDGAVGRLTVKGGGRFIPGVGIAPGTAAFGVANDLVLQPGASLEMEIRNTTPGTGHDQVVVGGAVTVEGARFSVDSPPQVPSGTALVLINKVGSGAINGTFKDLPQSTIIETDGALMQARYNGGTGNDFVLASLVIRPVLSRLMSTGAVEEGSVMTFNGAYLWPTASDVLKLVVDWGDGTPLTTNNVSGGSFVMSHIYADDYPSGVNEGPRTVTAYLISPIGTDSEPATAEALVRNRTPFFMPGTPIIVGSGMPMVKVIDLIDPGADEWDVEVTWGDGTILYRPQVGPDKKIHLLHQYAADGIYKLTVLVRDDDFATFEWDLVVIVGLKLAIEPAPSGQVKLSWDKKFPGMIVQWAPTHADLEWASLENAPALVGERYELIVPAEDEHRFYRLWRP